jgi:putative Mg2+ transporter-C (MgtC) family protein
MFCGGAVGYGRSKKERPAGLRTYMLVCLGAAAAVLMSLYLYQMLNGMWAETTAEVGSKFDAARYAAQAVAGIGFIGAGIIIKVSHSQVSGLTTAAGLWTTGIIGLAIGSGYYELGIVGAVLVLLAETVFDSLGRMIRHTPDYTLEIHYNEKNCLDEVLRYCKDSRMAIVNLKIHTLEGQDTLYAAEVKVRGNTQPEPLTEHISQMAGVVSVAAL